MEMRLSAEDAMTESKKSLWTVTQLKGTRE